MGQYYVGLDVHSRQSVFVVEREDGTVTARGEIPTTTEGLRQLRARHGLPPGTAIALETGTLAFYVARELMRLELTPVVIGFKVPTPLRPTPRSGAGRSSAPGSRSFPHPAP
jgi:hypothetical protein